MAVYSKCKTSDDIVNGLATVMTAAGTPSNYDPPALSQHFTSGDQLMLFRNPDGRFLAGEWSRGVPAETASASDVASSASGVDASIYLRGREFRQHLLYGVAFSYDSTPTSGELVIQSPSGTTVFSQKITSSGPGFYDWDGGLRGAESSDMLISLKNGHSSKTLSLRNHRTE